MSEEEEENFQQEDGEENYDEYNDDSYFDEHFDDNFNLKEEFTDPDTPPVNPRELNSGVKGAMATMLKEQGNEFFKTANFEAALNCYISAISHDPENSLLFLNKSQCEIKLNNYTKAVESANDALKLSNGKGAKGWYRRGTALLLQEDVINAVYDFKEAHIREPNDKDIKLQYDSAIVKLISILPDWQEKDSRSKDPYWMNNIDKRANLYI